MQVKISSPEGKHAVIEYGEEGDNNFSIVSGDVTREEMANALRSVKPFGPTGETNDINAQGCFVLRSLEFVGWLVDWPEVEGDTDDDDGEYVDQDIIVH